MDLAIRKGDKVLGYERDDYGTESTLSRDSHGRKVSKPKKKYYPEERMARFSVIPNKEKLFWMNYYYSPYEVAEFNTQPCMRFSVDEKKDHLAKMEYVLQT